MSDALWIALIAMFTASLSSPLLVAWYQAKKSKEVAVQAAIEAGLMAKATKEVADRAASEASRAAKATNAVAVQAAEAAKLLLQSNYDVAQETHQSRVETTSRLDAIHTLVNSNMTSAMERELSATRAMLVQMREVISLKEDRGVPIMAETTVIIREVEKRIKELADDLRYKKQQTDLAEAELKRRGQPSSPSEDPLSPEYRKPDPFTRPSPSITEMMEKEPPQ